MNFFQFLVVQNSKSEAERYLTGSLHTQLEVWNAVIALFGVEVQDVHWAKLLDSGIYQSEAKEAL